MRPRLLRKLLHEVTNSLRRRYPIGRRTGAAPSVSSYSGRDDSGTYPAVIRIVCPLRNTDFVVEHVLNNRAEYWGNYGAFIARGLKTLGIPLIAPAKPAEDFVIEWHFDDGRCLRTGVSFSDFAGNFDSSTGVDALFKLRCHPGRVTETMPPIPIAPGGFGLAVDATYGDNDAFMATDLPRLRKIKDEETQAATVFFNIGHFRTVGRSRPDSYPNRKRFLEALGGGPIQDSAQWQESVARSAWVLNLCGSGNSIDRKVVELCAIGCAIVSDRGLEDLELPYGQRFVHGKNIWFIDDPEDIRTIPDIVVGDVWRRLIEGSRILYETCFRPDALGRWYWLMAREWGKR